MSAIETVKIKCAEAPNGFMRINASDFVEGEHELFVEGAPGVPLVGVPAGTPALDPNADPSLPNETAVGGFQHVSGNDPSDDRCVVCSKPEPHSHVPTVEEYVAAGYSAEGHARRFWNQKPGDVYSEELDSLPKPEPAKKASEGGSAANLSSAPEDTASDVAPASSGTGAAAVGSPSDAQSQPPADPPKETAKNPRKPRGASAGK